MTLNSDIVVCVGWWWVDDCVRMNRLMDGWTDLRTDTTNRKDNNSCKVSFTHGRKERTCWHYASERQSHTVAIKDAPVYYITPKRTASDPLLNAAVAISTATSVPPVLPCYLP